MSGNLQELSEKATPGEWDVDGHTHLARGCRCLSCHDEPTVWRTTNVIFCDEQPATINDFGRESTRCEEPGYSYNDAALIVALVNAFRAGELVPAPVGTQEADQR
jgi:hypothetical protein